MAEMSEASKQWYASPGFVYFIAAGEPATAIKIGVAVQAKLKQRLRSHQSSNHEPLHLIGVIPTASMSEAEGLEKEWHRKHAADQRFKHLSVGHEWFNASEALLSAIDTDSCSPKALEVTTTVAELGPGLKG